MRNLYEHGGNIYDIEPRKQKFILDFSANINPLRIPLTVKKSLHRYLNDLVFYPDPKSRLLITTISDYWKIKEENLLVGNGSTELIYLVLNAFRDSKVTIVVPSFTEYERAGKISNCKLEFVFLKENKNFCFNPSDIKKTDILLICNPNNPTGNFIVNSWQKLLDIPAGKIFIDEAFMDFIPDEKKYTFIPLAVSSKKFIVFRTFTKFFALAGLRIGYLIAHKDIVRILKKYQIPWNVNILAQRVAAQCLKETLFIKLSKQLIEKERKFLYQRLCQIKGLKPYSSVTNFLLVKITKKHLSSSVLKKKLLEKGILIRDCANFRGLDNSFIRVAVRKHKENLKLIRALEGCI
ncbi:MAG: threonine-phosphate decarboxylase CobD [Candidatus Omnitrophica bacterium]|nr:threonine-phosphate decarboxylase CobD [Candidatus Omnitrophota bacterium]